MSIVPTEFSRLGAAGYEQTNRLLELTTPLGANRLLAETLSGSERIGDGGYCLELSALSDDANIDLTTLMGQPARLSLQSALGRGAPRLWHGYVTGAEFEAANGGFARYRLRVEPWLAFLRARTDSFAFQDKTVFDIIENVFADYQGQGKLAPAWRWDVADRSIYPVRSLTTQYRESDFAFVERLLAEEGLFYWFEHESADGDSLGRHTMVIADHNGAFTENAQADVRFHRADATETADSVQGWRPRRRWQTNGLKWSSWDYRSLDVRSVSADAQKETLPYPMALTDIDYAGQYAYEDQRQGERLVHNALAASRVFEQGIDGEGTVRTLAPGTRFALTDHWLYPASSAEDANVFAVLSVEHSARNNFDESMARAVSAALDAGAGRASADADFYRNRFTAIHIATEYRPASRDEHGARLLPRPTVVGAQTAIVVGQDNPVHSDRDHRIKVQFHWQRGAQSSSRLAHPGGENAPADDGSGTWVRVAEPVAGGDWGANFVPRPGQEVLIEFLHGDIDRPVVVGAVYNGAGAVDAQYNATQAGAARATGNAPAWFAGEKDAHGHNAVLTGLKTQELAQSREGTGGYNQVVFDDTPQQARLTVSTTQSDTRLNLGHIKRQQDNQRLADLGFGAELSTQDAVSIRAAKGLLISADAQPGAAGALLDATSAVGGIENGLGFADELAQAAQNQLAAAGGDQTTPDTGDKDAKLTSNSGLPALQALAATGSLLGEKQSAPGPSDKDIAGGDGEVTAYGHAHIQFSAPKGIAQYTPANAFVTAGNTLSQTAQNVDWAAGSDMVVAAAKGIVLFARGETPPSQSPIQKRGIALHAASGKLAVQSLKAKMGVAAHKTLTVLSTHADVKVNAASKILATAGGAYMKVEGGNIQLHAPGKVELRAASHAWNGPQSASSSSELKQSELQRCQARDDAAQDGAGSVPR